MKICPRCHRRRPRSAFAPCTQYPSGLAVWCRACQAHDAMLRYKRQRGYLGPHDWPPPPRQTPGDTGEMTLGDMVFGMLLVIGLLLLITFVAHAALL